MNRDICVEKLQVGRSLHHTSTFHLRADGELVGLLHVWACGMNSMSPEGGVRRCFLFSEISPDY